MTVGYKLTADEKKKVYDYAIEKARIAFPNSSVSLTVDDHLDANGKTNWRITVVAEGHF